MMVGYRESRVEPPPSECPLSECMRLLTGTWTINIIWYLRAEPRRFSELRGDLPGISAKMMTARLRRLEREGLVRRHVLATSPPTVEYELTEFGQRLLPPIESLVEVGRQLKRLRQQRDEGRRAAGQ